MINMVLIVTLLILAIADVVLTNIILARGGSELNPVMRYCMERFGVFWFMPKLAVTFAVAIGIFIFVNHWIPFAAMVAVQAGVVAWNIKGYYRKTEVL